MLGANYGENATKKTVAAHIGKPLQYVETSLYGEEYKDNSTMAMVGPNAYTNRKWFAQVTVKNGILVAVDGKGIDGKKYKG